MIEPNEPGLFGDPLTEGDFVNVHLSADLTKGHQGFVIEADENFIRLQMHHWLGLTSSAANPPCCNIEVLYPMASVAFVAHVKVKPVGCPCGEGLS